MLRNFGTLLAIQGKLNNGACIHSAGGIRTAWNIKASIVQAVVMLTGVYSIIDTLQLITEPFLHKHH